MVIAGAGGHAKEVLDVLLRSGTPKTSILFYDDINIELKLIHGYFKVVKNLAQLQEVFSQNPEFCLGLGNPRLRRKLASLFSGIEGKLCSVFGKCIVSNYSQLVGVDLMDDVYIGPNVRVGFGSLVNTKACIHHDAQVGDFCEISPNAVILGAAKVGHLCQIGASAVVLPKVRVGANVIVGAGSVVNRDLPDGVVATGIPARVIRKNTSLIA